LSELIQSLSGKKRKVVIKHEKKVLRINWSKSGKCFRPFYIGGGRFITLAYKKNLAERKNTPLCVS
jgi:hypothetical protein